MPKRRKDEKAPSVWRAILTLVLALILPACGEQPTYTSYAAADEAYQRARTEAEKQAAAEALEHYERKLEKARIYLEMRATCTNDVRYFWFCKTHERYNEKRPPQTIDETLKVYRADSSYCHCVSRNSI